METSTHEPSTDQRDVADHKERRPEAFTVSEEQLRQFNMVRVVAGPAVKRLRDLPSDKAYYVTLGALLGYPLCCVKEFLVRHDAMSRGRVFDDQPYVLHGTGFKPCAVCNKKSAGDPSELIAFIAAHRAPMLPPFPHRGAMDAHIERILPFVIERIYETKTESPLGE